MGWLIDNPAGAAIHCALFFVSVFAFFRFLARASFSLASTSASRFAMPAIISSNRALFACFNTMHAAVETRRLEIATLRALGYGGFAVAFSVILEAVALAIAGALIGAAIAWSLYNGVQGDMGGWEFFKLTVSPAMFAMAVGGALAVSILGSLLPSLRAARWSVADALRAR